MDAKIQVDYLGDGTFYEPYHPSLKIANIFGEIQIPTYDWDMNQSVVTWDFTIPSDIEDPFFHMIGLNGIDYFFTPVDKAQGKWRLSLAPRYQLQQSKGGPVIKTKSFGSPATNNPALGTMSKILYGGNRG